MAFDIWQDAALGGVLQPFIERSGFCGMTQFSAPLERLTDGRNCMTV